jgi:hypothetical protein
LSFIRSDEGLSNYALFSDTDLTVFVEGGASLSLEDVEAGAANTESDDLAFWQCIFAKYLPSARLNFKPVGSKATLRLLAEKVARKATKDVVVAMDRDLDNYRACMIENVGVIYSRAYSWENDVWSAPVISDTFHTFCAVSQAEHNIESEAQGAIDKSSVEIRRIVRCEIAACLQHIPVIPKDNCERLFDGPKAVAVKVAAVRACIDSARRARSSKCRCPDLSKMAPLDDCYGHLIEAFGYRLLSHLIRSKTKRKSLPREIVRRVAIGHWGNSLGSGRHSAAELHYSAEISKLVSAQLTPTSANSRAMSGTPLRSQRS